VKTFKGNVLDSHWSNKQCFQCSAWSVLASYPKHVANLLWSRQLSLLLFQRREMTNSLRCGGTATLRYGINYRFALLDFAPLYIAALPPPPGSAGGMFHNLTLQSRTRAAAKSLNSCQVAGCGREAQVTLTLGSLLVYFLLLLTERRLCID